MPLTVWLSWMVMSLNVFGITIQLELDGYAVDRLRHNYPFILDGYAFECLQDNHSTWMVINAFQNVIATTIAQPNSKS